MDRNEQIIDALLGRIEDMKADAAQMSAEHADTRNQLTRNQR